MPNKSSTPLAALLIGTIGVVYGDIGTSPLYALKTCFMMGHLTLNEANVLGIISLFAWALFLVVTLKYVFLVLRVDNHGEGGILALSTLCSDGTSKRNRSAIILAGILGAALFFSDGVITPAISVLSALEGLKVISSNFNHFIVPIAIILLIFLFVLQKRGTETIGKLFGPIMLVWFLVIGGLGLHQVCAEPGILRALNPYYAFEFFINNGKFAFLTLGGAILVVTGAEALYADMGHFGRKPISLSWNLFVFPSLLLNYLGQGSLLISAPESLANPFYSLAPTYALYPLIILATISTIIASQSVISGIFSVAWQGIMLEYLPRMRVQHTADHLIGQVYVPAINNILCIMTIAAVVQFKTSENLAVAYGLSVSAIMLITTLLVFLVAFRQWEWPVYKLAFLFTPLILIDLVFVNANIIKIVEGAWYTFLITIIGFYVVRLWMKGSNALNKYKELAHQNLKTYITEYRKNFSECIPGTAIFMSRHPNKVPNSLMIHLKHNKYLHEKMIFVSIKTLNVPRAKKEYKFSISKTAPGIFSIVAEYGFKEVPDLNRIVTRLRDKKILSPDECLSFYFSKGIPVQSPKEILSGFSEKLFIFLSRISLSAYEFYKVPHHQVIELGIRYKI